MPSTNLAGRHPVSGGRAVRPASVPVECAGQPPADLAAAWLIKRYRVRPNLAAVVALHAGLEERSARA
jgi:hypothetical protein